MPKDSPFRGRPPAQVAYWTKHGRMYEGDAKDILLRPEFGRPRNRFRLVLTSPPFPLNRKKRYGNLQGEEYVDWLTAVGASLVDVLADDGSIVIEMGNSWEPGKPVMSNLALTALLSFQERNGLHLCQEFIWSNPAKLPTPAQWVTIERIRVKDSFTRLWWLSPAERPRADNRRVLQPYSSAMQSLLRRGRYNAGQRPSQHRVGSASFLADHGGAIPGSVLTFANTASTSSYMEFCRGLGLTPHPARMPEAVAEFLIRFLTEPGDLVLDPFAGSNTTGAVAENLGRNWVSIERDREYVVGSAGRFRRRALRMREKPPSGQEIPSRG